MENKIRIGITDCKKYQQYELWFLNAPEDVEVVHLSYDQNNVDDIAACDGIVLSGGEDVHPERYNMPELLQHLNENDINKNRDEFEWQVIKKGIELNKPFLGICRGLQMMNVYLGGTLIPDIPTVKNHIGHGKINDIDGQHSIEVKENSLLQSITGNMCGEINSAHHQSANLVAAPLKVTATSKPDIVEALEWKEPAGKPFLLLVQWHPERMSEQQNPFAANIRKAFIDNIIPSK